MNNRRSLPPFDSRYFPPDSPLYSAVRHSFLSAIPSLSSFLPIRSLVKSILLLCPCYCINIYLVRHPNLPLCLLRRHINIPASLAMTAPDLPFLPHNFGIIIGGQLNKCNRQIVPVNFYAMIILRKNFTNKPHIPPS